MKLAIVGPNLIDQSKGSFHVHAAGCAHLMRKALIAEYMIAEYMVEEDHDSVRSVVESMYGPAAGGFYVEQWGDDVPADAWTHYADDFWFAPCVKLPEE